MTSDRIHFWLKRRRLIKPEELIPIRVYAANHFVSERTVRRWIQRNIAIGFKIKRRWYIRPDPLPEE